MTGCAVFASSDITDIANPKYVGTCRLAAARTPTRCCTIQKSPDNVYVYISGSAACARRPRLSGCVRLTPDKDPKLNRFFRIEVIKVPLAHPEQAAIVSSPRNLQ